MKTTTIHYQRLYNDTEAYCGATLHDGNGSVIKRNHTIHRNSVTCKKCRRKIQRDVQQSDDK